MDANLFNPFEKTEETEKQQKNTSYSMKLLILDAVLIRYSQLGHGLQCTLLFCYSKLLKLEGIAVVALLWFGCLVFIICLFGLT